MSCSCQQPPCTCGSLNLVDPSAQSAAKPTRCDRYVPGTKNVWVERGDSPNDVDAPGVCMLDTMTDCQIINSLERDDLARADLLTVTSDPHLLELARTVPRLPTPEQADIDQALLNKNHSSIPLYSIFRGNPPFAQ